MASDASAPTPKPVKVVSGAEANREEQAWIAEGRGGLGHGFTAVDRN